MSAARIVTDMRTGHRSPAGPGWVAMQQRVIQEREDEATRAAMAATWFDGLCRRQGSNANEPSWAEVVS